MLSSDYDGDAPDYRLISERRVKGRKPYVCRGCRDIIPAGTEHTLHVYLIDGEFFSERHHGPLSAYPVCPRDIEDERRYAAITGGQADE